MKKINETFRYPLYFPAGSKVMLDKFLALSNHQDMSFNQIALKAFAEYVDKYYPQCFPEITASSSSDLVAKKVDCCGVNVAGELCGEVAVGSAVYLLQQTVIPLCRRHYFEAIKRVHLWNNVKWLDKTERQCGMPECWRKPEYVLESKPSGRLIEFCSVCTDARRGHEKWKVIRKIEQNIGEQQE